MTELVRTGGSNLRQKRLNTFQVEFDSEVDGRKYEGKFVSRKLSIRDIAALGVRKSQLNGGMHHDAENPGYGVDEQTDEFNNMVAHLEIAIVEAPDWWDLNEITDVSLLATVYKEVIEFENKFLGRGSGDDSEPGNDDGGVSSGSGPENPSGTGSSGNAPKVVEQEVQSALEP